MKPKFYMNRRSFLKWLGGTAALSTLPPQIVRATSPVRQDSTFEPDVELLMRAVKDSISILEGAQTDVWHYVGEVVKGNDSNLIPIEGSYLGPSIHVRTGQKVRVRFVNELDEGTNIHWHGLHVPDVSDGHPRFLAEPNGEYIYEFEVKDRAGMYWYHPHPHERTGAQVTAGMAGLFFIHDDDEDAASLPSGEHEIPIVLQDRRFAEDNQIVYIQSMHDRMMGYTGNTLLLNGKLDNAFTVENRPYRLRFLNGSSSRNYLLSFTDQTLFGVIGTEGGLLDEMLIRETVTLAPAQRLDIWMDFSRFDEGDTISLLHNGQSTVAEFTVKQSAEDVEVAMPQLAPLNFHDPTEAVNADDPRRFVFAMPRMNATINGRNFEMEAVADDEMVTLGDSEVWEFYNNPQQSMMLTTHPIHVHGLQFQVLERRFVDVAYAADWQILSENTVDEGWHDTVLVAPGERVRVLLKFTDYEGLYLYHCHNLEHEDMGMMRNYRVTKA